MVDRLRPRDLPWRDNPEPPEEPDPNDVPTGPSGEDDRLHEFIEDLLSGPEPYESGPYTGDDSSDDGFYSDAGDDDGFFNDWADQ